MLINIPDEQKNYSLHKQSTNKKELCNMKLKTIDHYEDTVCK